MSIATTRENVNVPRVMYNKDTMNHKKMAQTWLKNH